MQEYIVIDSYNGFRLDYALAKLTNVSRAQIQKFIRKNLVYINGNIVNKLDFKICTSQKISIDFTSRKIIEEEHLRALDIALDIVHEDEDILVINKPVGLVVHPGVGHRQDTLVNGLIFHCKNLSNIGDITRPGIVHRLDKDTSGLLLVAKNNYSHNLLSKQIFNREVIRKYKAIVWGKIKTEGIIKTNLMRSRSNHKKMSVTLDQNKGKKAITHYKLLKNLNYFSFIECILETGRTHQIRAHLSHIGHSIVGDQTYGSNMHKILKHTNGDLQNELLRFKSQALHAYFLGFNHPVSGKKIQLKVDISNDMNQLLSAISNNQFIS